MNLFCNVLFILFERINSGFALKGIRISTCMWIGCLKVLVSSSWLPNTRKTHAHQRKSWNVSWRLEGPGESFIWREPGSIWPRRKETCRDLWCINTWWGGIEETSRLLSVPSDRQGSGHEIKRVKFHLNKRKHFFFTVRVVRHWNMLPRQVIKSPEFLEISLGTVLGSWL